MNLTPIKLQRLRAGWRQIEVAIATGIPRCRLSELERIAAALGVPVEALTAVAETDEHPHRGAAA